MNRRVQVASQGRVVIASAPATAPARWWQYFEADSPKDRAESNAAGRVNANPSTGSVPTNLGNFGPQRSARTDGGNTGKKACVQCDVKPYLLGGLLDTQSCFFHAAKIRDTGCHGEGEIEHRLHRRMVDLRGYRWSAYTG